MLVREIAHKCKPDVLFQVGALLALQQATEMHIVRLLEHAMRAAIHAARVTAMQNKMLLALVFTGVYCIRVRSTCHK